MDVIHNIQYGTILKSTESGFLILKVNQLKAGALLSYTAIFINIIITLFYTPVMLRLLGQSEYGLYALIGSVVGYLSVLDLGLGNAIVRYTARNRVLADKEEESNLNGMFLVLYSFIGILTIIIGAILYSSIDHMFSATLSAPDILKAKTMMIMLIFNLAISFPLGIFGSIMQAYERFVMIRIVSISRSLITPCVILPLLFLGYGSISMVMVNTLLNIVSLLLNLFYCFKVLKISICFKKFDLKLFREIAGYSAFIFLNIVVDKVLWSSDQFILGVVSGTLSVAVFAVAMQLNNMYMMFSTSVSGVLLPRITVMVANNACRNELTQMMIKVGRVQYVVLAYILSVFVLFGKAFINLWAGLNYSQAYYIALLVMIPLTIPLIQNVGISILQAQNRNAFRSIVYLGLAVLNICASIPLAKMWGGLGSALATGVSLFIGNIIIMNIYYHRKIGLNILLFWRNIAAASKPVLAALLLGYGVNYIIIQNSSLFLAIKIALFSVAYVSLMWYAGLNNFEKELFYSPLKRVLRTSKNFSEV